MKLRIEYKPPARLLEDLTPQRYSDLVEGAVEAVAKAVKVDFAVTTQTWEHQPDFQIKREGWTRIISTNDKVYFFLDQGTSVRYATMTKNFRAKSRIGQIKSLVGKGGVAYISRKRPRPGIEARKFAQTIRSKWEGRLKTAIERSLKAGQVYGGTD